MQLSSRQRQVARTIAFVACGFFIVAGGAALYIWFAAYKPYAESLERPRVPMLKKIAAAQTQFRDRDLDKDGIRDYANLKELIKAKLLTKREVDKAGLVFVEPAISDSKNRWWAVAQPLHPFQGRAFFINQSGIIQYTSQKPYTLESHINRNTAESTVEMRVLNNP